VLHSPSVRRRLALTVCAFALGIPAALSAQNRFEITPWVGSFFSMGDFYNDDFDLTNIGGTGTTNITVSQENTAMFGIRATVPVGPVLAMEGSFGFARSNVRFVIKDAIVDGTTGAPLFDASTTGKGNIIIGSLRAVIKPRRSNLSLILGAIIVKHGGPFWDDPTIDGKLTSFGGVAGIGLRANVTPRFPITIRAEGNFYNFDPDKGDNASAGFYPGKFQSDLIFSVGVPIGGH
jgi:hypothetical protein